MSEWTGASVYIDIELLKNLPVEVAFAEEIRLKDLPGSRIEGGLLSSASPMRLQNGEKKVDRYALYPAYPYPFNPSTTIAFDILRDSFVELKIYDTSGREVRTVVSQNMDAGSYHTVWDGMDGHGSQAASGVYFYRFQAGEFTGVNKMMLIR